jgi:hypothetical protein
MDGSNQMALARATDANTSIADMIETSSPVTFKQLSPGVLVQDNGYFVKNYGKYNITGIPPINTAGIPTFFATSSTQYFDFLIPKDLAGPVTRLDLTVSFNVTTNPVTLAPFWFLPARLEVYGPGSTVPLESYQSNSEFVTDLIFSLNDFNALESVAAIAGTTAPTYANTAYPVGSYQRTINLGCSFLNSMKPIPASVDTGNMWIRLYPESWGAFASAGLVTDITCTALTLNISYDAMPSATSQAILSTIRDNSITTSFVSPVQNWINTLPVSFVSGSPQSFQLTAIQQGYVAGFILFAQSTTYNIANKLNFDISNYLFRLEDASGNIKIQQQTLQYFNYDTVLEKGDVLLTKPSFPAKYYVIGVYGSSAALNAGSCDGGLFLRNTDRIVLTPNSSIGPLNIGMIPLYYRKAVQVNGRVMVTGN